MDNNKTIEVNKYNELVETILTQSDIMSKTYIDNTKVMMDLLNKMDKRGKIFSFVTVFVVLIFFVIVLLL